MTTIFIYESSDEDIPAETEAYYEVVASQEEIYLEEREEELRMILESDDPLPPRSERPGQQRVREAEEELITGDSDDPPISEEALEEMLRTT